MSTQLIPVTPPPAEGSLGRGGRSAGARWALFIARRLVRLIVSLFILMSATFIMIHLIPGDPVRAALGDQATQQLVALRSHQLGLDRPLFIQYLSYLKDVCTGNFGQSIIADAPVSQLLITRFPNTLKLALPAFVLVILIAMPVGLFTAVRTHGGKGRITRTLFVGITGLLNSIPDYVLATLLSIIFVIGLQAFPASGDNGIGSFVLPIAALVVGPASSLSRIVRVEALKVLDAEYIRAAKARRLPTLLRYWRHVLPNMMTASLTFGAMILAGLIAGTVLVENVFAWPGVGTVISQAVSQKDYPEIQGVLLVLGATVLILNMVVDVLLGVLDPKSRIGG